jgi:hypothetical protein
MTEITSGQKRLIRKLIAGEKLTRYSSRVVGRNPSVTYDLTDGTTVKPETVGALLSQNILVWGKSEGSTGYGYQNRTTEYKLDEKYVRDFNKYQKGKK